MGSKGKTIRTVLTDSGFTVGSFERSMLGDHVGQMMAVKMIKIPGCAFMVKKLSVKQVVDGDKMEFDYEQTVSSE